jgi:hypothetical protein
METGVIVLIFTSIFVCLFFYFLLKENSEIKNLRKNYTELSFTQIKDLILKLRRDGVYVDDNLIDKISLHFNLQSGELINEVRLMNNEAIKPIINKESVLSSEPTAGDFLIDAGLDFKSLLNTFIFLIILEIILLFMAFISSNRPSDFNYTANSNSSNIWWFLMIILALIFGIYSIVIAYSGCNNLIKAGKKMKSM